MAICGRDPGRLEAAVAALRSDFGPQRVHGVAADCSKPDDMRRLADMVKESLGGVDIWINNAGAW